MADKKASEAIRSLHLEKIGTRSDPTERFATGDEPGRADLMCVRGGRGVYIEIKGGISAFNLDDWRPNQRAWAETYALAEPYSTEVYLWFYLGKDRPNLKAPKYEPRKTWLIPVQEFAKIDSLIRPYQGTLVYQAKKGHRKPIQDGKLDAITLLAKWELKWQGAGIWKIPADHTFAEKYINSPALFDINQRRLNQDDQLLAAA